MRSLITDLKARRPLLINPTLASDFLERAASLEIPLTAKSSDIGEMLAAVYGAKPVLEKFPPFAVVPVRGVIGRGLSELEKMCGCCDLKSVEEMLEDCERDEAITTIILAIDSPGGTSVGVPELASRIREMSKKVIAFTDNEACSAAYWLGSQASEFYATPSSSVGSVGCYIAYEDESKRYADAGVIVDVIRAGKYKGAGISGTSLTEDQRNMLQGEVVEIWESFKADVKMVREFVDESSLEAQIFSGRKAADLGLVTGLVRGFDEMMELLAPDVAAQMEADESNDERAEGGESEEAKVLSRFAAARALGGKLLKALSAAPKMKSEGDEEEEDDEDKKESEDKDEDTEPKSDEDADEEKKDEPATEGDEDEKSDPESDDEEPAKDDEKKDDEEKSEDPVDDDKDEKGEPPQPSAEDDEEKKDDEKKSEPESEDEEKEDDEDLKDEAESGDDAVDTDGKHNKRGAKRSRGRVA